MHAYLAEHAHTSDTKTKFPEFPKPLWDLIIPYKFDRIHWILLYEVMGLDAMILVFWMLSFKPTFPLSSFMEFRKMVTITLCTRQQKRHWCIEQSYGLCGRGRGWEDLGEWHWNMYIIIYETNRQSRFDAWDRMLRAGALGWPRGMVWGR